jgi:hypothetical protein
MQKLQLDQDNKNLYDRLRRRELASDPYNPGVGIIISPFVHAEASISQRKFVIQAAR